MAHRVIMEELYGALPRDWDVHHRCGTKGCINVLHLQALPRGEHLTAHGREWPRATARRAATHCERGHEWTEANTYRWRGGRKCRACHAARERARRERDRLTA